MSEFKHSNNDPEIVYSQSFKAGRRTYFLDVKKTNKGEMYLTVTESKKTTFGDSDMPQVSFEKHKIFLYPEDFDRFTENLNDTIQYITNIQGKREPRAPRESSEIQMDDIEF